MYRSAGYRDKMTLRERWPEVFENLLRVRDVLEDHFREVYSFEFTVERGQLYISNARPARSTPMANLYHIFQFYQEGKIGLGEAVARVRPSDIEAIVHPEIINEDDLKFLGIGNPTFSGAATGKLVLSRKVAEKLGNDDQAFIFIRDEVMPEDIDLMHTSQGVLTARGGMTSHAAIVCRALKKPCVVGFGEMNIFQDQGEVLMPEQRVLHEEDWITINSSTGKVYAGKGELILLEWQQIPELYLLAQMIEHLIISADFHLGTVGLVWLLRDYFVHSRPLRSISTKKRPVRQHKYTSFVPPRVKDISAARKTLHPIATQQRENYSQIIFGFMDTLSRILASRQGLGNHHKYFRPLWDPETTYGPNGDVKIAQFVGFEYFNINRIVPHLIDISCLTFLLELKLSSQDDRWFLDFTNPDGESLILNSNYLLGYKLIVNGASVRHDDIPSLYNALRSREYYWRWYEYNKTSYEEIVDFLKYGKYKSSHEFRLALYCEELGLLSHGELTFTGLSIIGENDGGKKNDFFKL